MHIDYNEDKHEYSVDGKVLSSVTQLAKQFSGLDTSWFEAHPELAERGTAMHNELYDWYENGQEPTSDKACAISKMLLRQPEMQKNEVMVYNLDKGYAGTADMIVMSGDKVVAIIDFKSSYDNSITHRNYYTCQLNLYRLALESMGAKFISTLTADLRMLIIAPTGVYDMRKVSWEEMQEMNALTPLQDDLLAIEDEMAQLEDKHARYEELKAQLVEGLKKQLDGKAGVVAGSHYKFTCTGSSVRRTFDQNKAKALINNDEAFNSCYRESTVSASVRVKSWESENDSNSN